MAGEPVTVELRVAGGRLLVSRNAPAALVVFVREHRTELLRAFAAVAQVPSPPAAGPAEKRGTPGGGDGSPSPGRPSGGFVAVAALPEFSRRVERRPLLEVLPAGARPEAPPAGWTFVREWGCFVGPNGELETPPVAPEAGP